MVLSPIRTTYSTGSYPSYVAVGDFNNDTYLDIVVANQGDNNISVLLGYGDGSFANQTTYSTGSYPQSVAVGNFNSDRHLDIVVANYDDNDISVLLGYVMALSPINEHIQLVLIRSLLL